MESEYTISSKALQEYEDLYLCPISMVVMQQPFALPCQHTFEFSLLKQHLQNNQECPMCRKQYRIEDAHRNILAKQSISIFKKQVERKKKQKELKKLKEKQQIEREKKEAQQKKQKKQLRRERERTQLKIQMEKEQLQIEKEKEQLRREKEKNQQSKLRNEKTKKQHNPVIGCLTNFMGLCCNKQECQIGLSSISCSSHSQSKGVLKSLMDIGLNGKNMLNS